MPITSLSAGPHGVTPGCGLALCLMALVWSGQASAMNTTEAQALAEEYCAAAMLFDEAAAEALMTPALRTAIEKARAVSMAFEADHPGDKPPLGDGLRLTAYQDAPESCTPTAVTATGAVLEYAPAGDPLAVWRDRIEMERDAYGDLAISDVVYAPDQMDRFSTWLAGIIDAP